MINEVKHKIIKTIFDLKAIESQITGFEARIRYLEGCLAQKNQKGVFVPFSLLQLDNETLGVKVKQLEVENTKEGEK